MDTDSPAAELLLGVLLSTAGIAMEPLRLLAGLGLFVGLGASVWAALARDRLA